MAAGNMCSYGNHYSLQYLQAVWRMAAVSMHMFTMSTGCGVQIMCTPCAYHMYCTCTCTCTCHAHVTCTSTCIYMYMYMYIHVHVYLRQIGQHMIKSGGPEQARLFPAGCLSSAPCVHKLSLHAILSSPRWAPVIVVSGNSSIANTRTILNG